MESKAAGGLQSVFEPITHARGRFVVVLDTHRQPATTEKIAKNTTSQALFLRFLHNSSTMGENS